MSDAATQRDRGNALYLQGQYEEAAECYRAALRWAPDDFDALNNLGAALADLGRLGEAVACYEQAIRIKPGLPEAHYNLGNLFRLAGHPERAVECYARALRLRPEFAEGHNNLGIVLRRLGRFSEAMTSLRRALVLRPGYPAAEVNLGLTLADTGRFAEALAHYEEVLAREPANADAHHNRALAWLTLGDWEQGWPEYEWRWRTAELRKPPYSQPVWDGSPLAGRTILLYTEQGSGDIFQCVRFASAVKPRGGTVVLAAPERLHPLLATAPGIDRLVPRDDPHPEPACHLQHALMSLPARLGTTVDTMPAPVPYLRADRARSERWRGELQTLAGLKVGIAWRGSPKMLPYDLRRSIPLEQFEPLARVDGVRLLSLQAGAGSEEPGRLGGRFPVLDLAARFDESAGAFLDTAAVMTHLDLVVTCDTAIAHLAGALGVPAWVALPSVPHWTWLLDRETSPWYPTVRLFRQAAAGAWDEVFHRMAAALRPLAAGGASEPGQGSLIGGMFKR
jgi:Flp pilus assembly protein TadD